MSRRLTATHIAYYHTCQRKLWLFAHGIQMEHTSTIVAEGKLIGETSYSDRAEKYTEIEIDGIKIDYFDAENGVVHEVKKSAKMEHAHLAQIKYYIWKLTQMGLENITGVLEYPKLKQRQEVILTAKDIAEIQQWETAIEAMSATDNCPPVIQAKICQSCSYYDFCYTDEAT
ncbi:MAG: CRISPR-associated protein Cas4 [Bacteroidota bacterium]